MSSKNADEPQPHKLPSALERLRSAVANWPVDTVWEKDALTLAQASSEPAPPTPNSDDRHLPEAVTEHPLRVFICYAHESAEHLGNVSKFAEILQANTDLTVHFDQWATGVRQNWETWSVTQMNQADFVLFIASPAHTERVRKIGPPGMLHSSRFESAVLQKSIESKQASATPGILSVILPNSGPSEIPAFCVTHSNTIYEIDRITPKGIGEILAALMGNSNATPAHTRSLTASLEPVRKSYDIRFTTADIRGLRHKNSIACRPGLFASSPTGNIEYALNRSYRRFESVIGIHDIASSGDQSGIFQVFLDNTPQVKHIVRAGMPVWIRHDVTDVHHLKLIAWSPETPGDHMETGGRTPELTWGSPTLIE
ncbi:SEFIR domain-containing protein [Actinokineospora enzanensis]|uniref:SEFIR domain-containing protein n=1 Tax=Actinokineospora enzanensis TaxID=155975 RepID=UPI000A055010|nr:SEFIR domain-containing protein [Actinokineospora enzanensis]